MTKEEQQKDDIETMKILFNADINELCNQRRFNNAREMEGIRDRIIQALEQQPSEDCISRQALKQKLQEHHDFFVNAYGSFKDMPHDLKVRVDEITNCIAEVVNAPSVTPRTNLAETSQDCISRAELMQKLNAWDSKAHGIPNYAWKVIRELPSVTPTNEDIKEAYLKGYDYGVKDWFKSKTQPCEDAVSRKRIIILIDEASEIHPYKVVGDYDTYSDYNQGWSDACDWLYANIEGIPPITPQRPKGKWIEYEVDVAPHPLHCSLCGFSNHHISDRYIKEFRRCPNCGAEMIGGGEDEDRKSL